MDANFFSGLSKQQITILAIAGGIILLIILGVIGVIPIFKSSTTLDSNFPTGKITLEVWGIGDEAAAFADITSAYQAQPVSKNVSVKYTKFDSVDVYEKSLTTALAEGRGPDIFMVKNTWIPKDAAKLQPAPLSMVSPLTTQQLFPQAVSKDMVLTASDGQSYVFALPLHFDALALLYNKDIFNAKAIIYPPKTWDEVVQLIPKLRELDAQKNIQTSPIALGSVRTIGNFDDILSLIMLQSGAVMNTANGVLLDGPAQQAISFYTQFSNPTNPYYTWNDSLGNARGAFAAQKTAMIIDTYAAIADVQTKNNFINIGTAQVPQLSQDSKAIQTLASYWGLGVSRQAKVPYVAWHFIRFATMTPEVSKAYVQKTNKLPALLSLIEADKNGENGAFLKSFLVAKTWTRPDDERVKNVFAQMLENIVSGKMTVSQSARSAQEDINSQ